MLRVIYAVSFMLSVTNMFFMLNTDVMLNAVMLSVITLSVIMQNAVMLSVIILSVVMPQKRSRSLKKVSVFQTFYAFLILYLLQMMLQLSLLVS
jgi:hypothetical protein